MPTHRRVSRLQIHTAFSTGTVTTASALVLVQPKVSLLVIFYFGCLLVALVREKLEIM